MKKIFLEEFFIFLRGLLMGAADIVPGVSGGTIALITGIYQRFIDGIHGVFEQVQLSNVKLLFKGKFKKVWKNILKIDFALFIPLVIGIGTAFLTMSTLMHYLMQEHTVLTYVFFMGLILGSSVLIYKQLHNHSWNILPFFIVGFILSFILVGLEGMNANHSITMIFVSGAIAICAMVLPGISGSFMLVLLNQYEFMITAIKNLQIKEIVIFAAGAFTGLLFFSKALSFLLHKHRNRTLVFLIGLMLGSIRLQVSLISASTISWLPISIVALLGFFVVFGIERLASSKQ
jgi:putative membrane protein